MRFRLNDPTGFGVLRDASLPLPPGDPADPRSLRDGLRAMARRGEAFVFDGEEGIDFEIEVVTPGETATVPLEVYEPTGGSWLLRVPSGRITVSGGARPVDGSAEPAIVVPPGNYVLSLHSLEHPDLEHYDRRMRALVGEERWEFRNRVDRLALVGCLGVPLLAGALLVPAVRRHWPVAVGVFLLLWLPHAVLRLGRRYREVERAREEIERGMPLFHLRLDPVTDDAGLVGGWHLLT